MRPRIHPDPGSFITCFDIVTSSDSLFDSLVTPILGPNTS
jgi:hypothetical protein